MHGPLYCKRRGNRRQNGNGEINGTASHALFGGRLEAVCAPFSTRSHPVFIERARVERPVYGKFFLTHTVHVLFITYCSRLVVVVFQEMNLFTYF